MTKTKGTKKTKYKNLPTYQTVQEKYLQDLNDGWYSIGTSSTVAADYGSEYDEWANQRVHYTYKSKFEFKIGELVFIKTLQPYSMRTGATINLGNPVVVNLPYAPTTITSPSVSIPYVSTPVTTTPGTGITTPAPNWNITYSGVTTNKLGMTLHSGGKFTRSAGSCAAPSITTSPTIYSSSMVWYSNKPAQPSVNANGTNAFSYAEEFVAIGYKTIDDLLRTRDPVSIKQESTWSDEEKKEMATNKSNAYWSGKPFIGIIVDRYVPKNITDSGEEITIIGETNQLSNAYKVLFDENHCYWFPARELFPMKKKEETVK